MKKLVLVVGMAVISAFSWSDSLGGSGGIQGQPLIKYSLVNHMYRTTGSPTTSVSYFTTAWIDTTGDWRVTSPRGAALYVATGSSQDITAHLGNIVAHLDSSQAIQSGSIATAAASLANILTTISATASVTFASATSGDVSVDLGASEVDVNKVYIYLSKSTSAAFDAVCTMGCYEHTDRHSTKYALKVQESLVWTDTVSPDPSGTNTAMTTDSSSFTGNDLVWFWNTTPSTSETAFVSTAGGNLLTFEDNLVNNHVIGNGISRIRTTRSFDYRDRTGQGKMWWRLKFASSQTCRIVIKVWYRKRG